MYCSVLFAKAQEENKRLKRVPYLEPGAPILVSELEAWLETAKLELRPGDAVFIRTGRSTMPVTPPPMQIAGLHVSTVRWLKQHDIALLGSDVGADVWPSGVDGVRSPVHTLLLVAMGTPILDNCDLGDLSRAAAERQRWEFLVTLAPLRISGATGSAVNPVAVFRALDQLALGLVHGQVRSDQIQRTSCPTNAR